MKGKITKNAVDAMKPGDILADIEVKGFVARCLRKSGVITYGLRYRADGKQRWLALGVRIAPDQARKLAKKRAGEVADDRDPVGEIEQERVKAEAAKTSTVDALLDGFVRRHLRAKNLRSADEIERLLARCVRPHIGNRDIYELRRRDVVQVLDAVDDERGPGVADKVLAHLGSAFTWQQARDDDFVSPIAKGMRRTKAVERHRILSDDEIRDLWQALGEAVLPAPYPACVRALLLTAQRREEVGRMRWEEIEGDVWVIPAPKYKTKIAHAVPLTEAVQRLLGRPQKGGFIFTTTAGEKAFGSYSLAKWRLDVSIADIRKRDGRNPIEPWLLHDLRRTARSLMSRAGVMPDIAERVLGHKLAGVRAVYDRHDYEAAKRDALERLADLVTRILDPPKGNVISLSGRQSS